MRVHSQAWGHSINRNIVECKGFFFRAEFKSDSVLIETSWNVKYHSRPAHDRRRTVLIETSWNVKVFVNCSLLFAHGINRNIVECKENRENISESNCKSINRNIVECKDDIKLWNYSVKRVLIETSWNVKRKRNR